jgi:hypothetical protein
VGAPPSDTSDANPNTADRGVNPTTLNPVLAKEGLPTQASVIAEALPTASDIAVENFAG